MAGTIRPRTTEPSTNLLNPFRRFKQQMDHAMNDFYDLFESSEPSWNLLKSPNNTLIPSMDVVEDGNTYKIELEMAGLDEEDIKLSIDSNILKIEAEKTTSRKDDKKNYLTREINYGRYERCISLPMNADTDKTTATFKKGMLWVVIPKKAGTTKGSKKISIQKIKE